MIQKNLLGRRYVVKRYGRDHRWYFTRLKEAERFTMAQYVKDNGDWTITRIDRKGRSKVVWPLRGG